MALFCIQGLQILQMAKFKNTKNYNFRKVTLFAPGVMYETMDMGQNTYS